MGSGSAFPQRGRCCITSQGLGTMNQPPIAESQKSTQSWSAPYFFLPKIWTRWDAILQNRAPNHPGGSEEVRLEKLVPRNAIKSSGASIFVRLLPKPISKLVKRPFQGSGKNRVSSLVRPIFYPEKVKRWVRFRQAQVQAWDPDWDTGPGLGPGL